MKKIIPVNRPLFSKLEKNYLNQCIDSGWISSGGPFILKFENSFKKIVSRRYSAAVSNGTAAIDIAIKTLNLRKGDEIIVPNFTIISCLNEIIREGIKPIFIDADPNTFNIDTDQIESKITKKTKAILIVHIYGLPVNLDKIITLKNKYKLKLIEDCAEQLGQTYKRKPIGSFGDISTFSFYANKHITTGEGGMILTNDKSLYSKCKSLRNLSFSNSYFDRYNHDDIGWNYRMTNLQAALGCGQLKNIKKIIKRKREIGNIYYKNLKNNNKIILQQNRTNYSNNIYWVFGILLKKNVKIKRNNLMKKLLNHKIDTRPFFLSMNKQKIFKKMKLFINKKMPNSEYLSENGFYVPSGLGISNKEIKYICGVLNKIII